MNSALSLNGIKNDVFFISGGDSSNELNLTSSGVTTAVTIQSNDIKPFVLKSQEGAVHYHLGEPEESNSVGSSGTFILPDLEQRKYVVEVVTDDCQFIDDYTEDVSNDAPIKFSASKEPYVSQHFFATHEISSAREYEKVIPLPNYSSREYVLYTDSGLENSDSLVDQSNLNSSKISHKNAFKKSLKRPSKLQKISSLQFKKQLVDTSDIVSPLILLPHSKRLLEISSWNFDKSLVSSQRPTCKLFQKRYERNCISNEEKNEIETSELKLLPLGYKPEIDLSNIKRITRKRKNPHILQEQNSSITKTSPMRLVEEETTRKCEETPMEYVEALLGNHNVHENCFFFEADIRDTEEIIVIHDGHETAESTAYTHQNIDVLLAAAAKNSSKSIVIRKQSDQPISITQNTNRKEIVKANGQLIIV